VTKMIPAEKGVPPFVTFGGKGGMASAGYLGTAYNPFVVEGAIGFKGKGKFRGKAPTLRVRGIQLPNGFTLKELNNRDKLLQSFDSTFKSVDRSADLVDGFDAFHKQALEILRSDKTKKAFKLDEEKESVRERYGATPLGQGALAARRLVEAGVRFVTLTIG